MIDMYSPLSCERLFYRRVQFLFIQCGQVMVRVYHWNRRYSLPSFVITHKSHPSYHARRRSTFSSNERG